MKNPHGAKGCTEERVLYSYAPSSLHPLCHTVPNPRLPHFHFSTYTPSRSTHFPRTILFPFSLYRYFNMND